MDPVDFILWMRDDELGDRSRTWLGILGAIQDRVFTPGESEQLIERCAEVAGYRQSGRHSWLRNVYPIRRKLLAEKPLSDKQWVRLHRCAAAADSVLQRREAPRQ